MKQGAVLHTPPRVPRQRSLRRTGSIRHRLNAVAIALLLALAGSEAHAEPGPRTPTAAEAGARLIAAYPGHLERVDGNMLVWKDGTRMALDDGRGPKDPASLLASPDLKDMFAYPYPAGSLPVAPPPLADPGRIRNAAFFTRMYGDCRRGEVSRHLVQVPWLPRRSRQRLAVTRINGVAEQLRRVSEELDRLPDSFNRYLLPAAGAYVCRPIAGTNRLSAHGLGIAVDIATGPSHYWQWSGGRPLRWKNQIPIEIVRIFEKHGFVWGGRWHHHDTMHFEYRPELISRLESAEAEKVRSRNDLHETNIRGQHP